MNGDALTGNQKEVYVWGIDKNGSLGDMLNVSGLSPRERTLGKIWS